MAEKLDMTGWTDKDSKKPECRELYEEHDYITAYGKHSDLRVDRPDGFKGAIGRADEWESHGKMQLEFLQAKGLVPESHLLDFGCGCGRLARRAVPFLESCHYTGIDISERLLATAVSLSIEEGWVAKDPHFLRGDGTLGCLVDRGQFDLVWAHSVFTHCPPEIIRAVLEDLSQMSFGAFYFTYKHAPEPNRSGLKQFQYPPEWFQREAKNAGLSAEAIEKRWPAGQRTMKVWRP